MPQICPPERVPVAAGPFIAWPALAILCGLMALTGCGGGGGGASTHAAGGSHGVSHAATLRLEKRFAPKPSSSKQYGLHHIYRMTGEAPAPSIPSPGSSAKKKEKTSLPAASAGTNGSFVAGHGSASGAGSTHSVASMDRQMAAGRAVLLRGNALAPPSAPPAIEAAINAANALVGQPYVWGGGHSSWISRGYDCSGSVSFALGAAGFLAAPLDSSHLEEWGAPGPGRWMTVYANSGHAFAVIAGVRWDTVGDARGSGPRWHRTLASPAGFVARHPPGY
jgi:cell wall-associated NlpC family hydrolase